MNNDNDSEINYLGADWGEKRIGLALADSETKIALPFQTVKNIKELLEIVESENITCLVLGSPAMLSGIKATNPNYLSFLSKLKEQLKIDLINIDERMTSKGADVLGYGQKNRASRDEGAATLILQTYLDSISG